MSYHTPLPSGEPASEPQPTNPRPGTLSWDPPKQAFRPREAAKSCNCAELPASRLTGERLTCGLCDGRKTKPRRFDPRVDVREEVRCVACGELCPKQRSPWGASRLCPGCDAIRSRLPLELPPEQVMLEIHRRLNAADRRELAEDEVTIARKRRAANRRAADRRYSKTTPRYGAVAETTEQEAA